MTTREQIIDLILDHAVRKRIPIRDAVERLWPSIKTDDDVITGFIVDGLTWHVRDALYRRNNARVDREEREAAELKVIAAYATAMGHIRKEEE